MNTLTDDRLVQLLRQGNSSAFEELLSRYSAKAFSLACRLTKNPLDAEEVLQDVFVTVYRKIDAFEGKSSFSSWLYRITVNASFMKIRSKKHRNNVAIDELDPHAPILSTTEQDTAESHCARNEVRSALESAIEKLPEEYKPVFVLRDIDGMSSQEVSKILSLSIPAVKSRLHRSRTLIKKRLEKFYKAIAAL